MPPQVLLGVNLAKLLLDHGWRPDAHAVAERVAVVHALAQPMCSGQLFTARAKYAIVAAHPRVVAKHRSRREGIHVAPHDWHNDTGDQEPGRRDRSPAEFCALVS